MAKEPKPVDKLTKPELLAFTKRLHKRIVRLENEIARLQSDVMPDKPANAPIFPWEQE